MIFKLIAFSFVLIFHQFISAKDTLTQEQRFEQIYFETAVNLSGVNSKRAFEVSDSLYIHAASELQKVKALMLIATLLHQNGEISQSIIKALDADQIASKNSLVDWQARIAGFLSTRYRDLGLYKHGEVYLSKGKELGGKMKDGEVKNIYLGMVCQERAYYQLEYGNFKKALQSIEEASNYFHVILEGVNKSYFLATNEELLGRAYIGLGKPEQALSHFKMSNELLTQIGHDDATFTGLLNHGTGVAYMDLNQLDSAIVYLEKANSKANTSNYLILKTEVYKSLSRYYKTISDYANYAKYNDKYILSLKEIEQKKKEFINLFVAEIESRGDVLKENQRILIIILVVLLIVLISSVFFYQRSKKKDFIRFKNMMQELKSRNLNEDPITLDSINLESTHEKKKLQISESIEIKILEDLKKFEKGDKFTDKNMSLSALSALIGTNTKYLSYILNTHFKKDFNTYVNELRVKYIVLKMEKDPKYRSYKISYLAEESGFSSHSKFSAVFKTVTGFTPSKFLEFLAKEKSE